MWRLLVPLKYLLIKHPEKAKFDLWFPVVFACFFFSPIFSSQFRDAALGNMNILDRSSDLLSILTGFFVAALAAVSTFGGDEMDEIMPGHPPVTLQNSRGQKPEELSRRRFLSFLFGYLAFLSLALYLMGFVYYAIQNYFLAAYFPDFQKAFFVIFWAAYGLALGNLLANTLLGLFYLSDRIHRSNKKLNWHPRRESDGPDDQEAA